MSKRKVTNKEYQRRLSNKRLQPLIDWCLGPGDQIEVVRRLNAKMPHPVTLVHVWHWMHPEATKRKQPGHGMGILLEKVWAEIDGERNGVGRVVR